MKLLKEFWEDFQEGYGDWELFDAGDWVQDYKYQIQTVVSKHKPSGKFYSYEFLRSGSSFSDWYYPHQNQKSIELDEVKLVEKTVIVTSWEKV